MSEFSALLSCRSGCYSGSKNERLLNNIFLILNVNYICGGCIGVQRFIVCLTVCIQLPSFHSLHFPVDFVHVFLE